MDDLAGLDWSKNTSTKKPQNASYNYNTSAFSALRPTPPVSGRVTPLNNVSQPSSKPATPLNDSFSNLVAFSNTTSTTTLSLQEQERRLAALKVQEQKKTASAHQQQYTGGDDLWNNLGSGRSTPAPEVQRDNSRAVMSAVQEEDDMFAVFNAPAAKSKTTSDTRARDLIKEDADDDDDPFELSKIKPSGVDIVRSPTNGFDDDDDVLGLLGKPVSARPQPEPVADPSATVSHDANSRHRAIAELVDMGFPADRARQALDSTASGTDVQSAVGYLLNQAHQEARDRSQSSGPTRNGHSPVAAVRRGGERVDTRQQQERPMQDPSTGRTKQQASSEKDASQVASELGTNFLKTANSLWRQGQKRVQQAVQEFNSDSESSQPKWMQQPDRMAKAEARSQQRGDESGTGRRRRRSSQTQAQEQQSGTDEAMMLETQRPTPPPRQQPRSRADAQFDSSADNSRDHSPAVSSRLRDTHPPQPAFLRQPQPQKPTIQPPASTSRSALSRQAIDDQAAQAYVSSARRRKPAAQAPVAASESDLLDSSFRQQAPPGLALSRPSTIATMPKAASIPARPSAPPRNIPAVSAMSLKASHSHREKGNKHYKRGDYSSAHQAYTTSISHLPSGHPITVILLTNRALTALKTGEPKMAIADSDAAITVIGISKGESEKIDLSNGEPPKPMREYYGKALMRKAEALEQLENWKEAATVWREAVEGGHGGATSMQGRLRAEKAANPQLSKPKPRPPIAKKLPPQRSALTDLAGQDSKAVTALRAANVAAEKADDEKFALYDSVDLRIKTWRDGKQDNLRALLGSLDTVLWQGSGWKKIGMADLVLPGKVKVQYMKGIGKVHPDKIPTDATTEQRMISSAVFSTLNEAWDKFKSENGL